MAAFEGHKEVIEQLLAKGSDVNAKDNDGNTPLSLATARSNAAVVELLKAHGAKLDWLLDSVQLQPKSLHDVKKSDAPGLKA